MTDKIHRIDENIVELKQHSMDKWSLQLNGLEVAVGYGGLKKGRLQFHNMVQALLNTDYGYEEFVQDRVETDAMPENSEDASRYVLSRVYNDGSVEDLDYSDDRIELVELLRE